MRRLFYLVPVVLAVGIATRLYDLWGSYAMWNQGMDINADEIVVAGLSVVAQLAAIIGLLLRRRWAKILSYVLFSLLGVSVLLLFLYGALNGALVTAEQLGRAFAYVCLYVGGAGLCIWLVKAEYDFIDGDGEQQNA